MLAGEAAGARAQRAAQLLAATPDMGWNALLAGLGGAGEAAILKQTGRLKTRLGLMAGAAQLDGPGRVALVPHGRVITSCAHRSHRRVSAAT